MEDIRVALLSESQSLIEALVPEMRKQKYTMTVARNTKDGTSRILFEQPNVIIIDWVSILKDGIKLYKTFRDHPRTKHSYIIAIVSEEIIRKYDFQIELDDFVVTPIQPSEVDARIRKVKGRFGKPFPEEVIRVDGMEINEATYEMTIKGEVVPLTHKEFELLKFLTTNRGRVFSRDTLLSVVWKYDFYHSTRTVDIHIQRLRHKIGQKYAKMIKTVPNVGYKFIRE